MKESQHELLTAVRELTEQLEKLNSFLEVGSSLQPTDSNDIRDTLRAIASGEEPCVFMTEGTKVYEA